MGTREIWALVVLLTTSLVLVMVVLWDGPETESIDYATLVERILDDPRIVSNHDRVCLVRGDLIFGNGQQDFGPYTSAICGTVGIVGVDDSNEVPYD